LTHHLITRLCFEYSHAIVRMTAFAACSTRCARNLFLVNSTQEPSHRAICMILPSPPVERHLSWWRNLQRDFRSHNIFYVLDGGITPLRINRIANPEYKSGRLWRDEEKTWTLWGNEQQPKTLAGPLKVSWKKSNRISWDLSSFEYGRLAEGIVSGRQPLINLLVKSKPTSQLLNCSNQLSKPINRNGNNAEIRITLSYSELFYISGIWCGFITFPYKLLYFDEGAHNICTHVE